MFKAGQIIFLLSSFLIVFQMSCKRGNEILSNDENSEVPSEGKWVFIGLEGKSALRLVLAEPYLYVCAGPDGLWRRDIRKMTPWEYLGWADTSLSEYFYGGVQDVDVKGNDILLAYNPVHVSPWVSAGIWRSKDGGKTWFRSDIGIPDSSWPYSSYLNVQRSPDNPNIAITSFGGAIFRSTDGGTNWKLVYGRRGGLANKDFVKWQFNKKGLVWFYGESSIFSPYLFYSDDYGLTFHRDILPRVPVDNAVYDIAFDATEPNTVYVGMQGACIKSMDGGQTWIVPLFTDPKGRFFKAVVTHPRVHDIVYFAAGEMLYYSTDGGKTILSILMPNGAQILSMFYDEVDEALIVGTEKGIFKYKTKESKN
jgi:hypothetical protein